MTESKYLNAVCKGTACLYDERKYKCNLCGKRMCANCGFRSICVNCIAFILEKQTFFPMIYVKGKDVIPTPEEEIKLPNIQLEEGKGGN